MPAKPVLRNAASLDRGLGTASHDLPTSAGDVAPSGQAACTGEGPAHQAHPCSAKPDEGARMDGRHGVDLDCASRTVACARPRVGASLRTRTWSFAGAWPGRPRPDRARRRHRVAGFVANPIIDIPAATAYQVSIDAPVDRLCDDAGTPTTHSTRRWRVASDWCAGTARLTRSSSPTATTSGPSGLRPATNYSTTLALASRDTTP